MMHGKYVTFPLANGADVYHEADTEKPRVLCGKRLFGSRVYFFHQEIPDGKKLCDHCKVARERQTAVAWLRKAGN